MVPYKDFNNLKMFLTVNLIPDVYLIYLYIIGPLACLEAANGGRDSGSIPGRHTKDSKMVLNASFHKTHKVWIKGKWSNPGKEVAPSCNILTWLETGMNLTDNINKVVSQEREK